MHDKEVGEKILSTQKNSALRLE